MAALRARGAVALPRGCRGTRDQAPVGDKRLPAGTALDVLDCRPEHQPQARPKPWPRAPPIARGGVMRLRRFEGRPRAVAEPLVIMAHAGKGHVATVWPRRIGTARGDPVAMRRGGALLAKGGEGILTMGLWDRPEHLCTRAQQGYPTPEQVAGGPPVGRMHVGLGQQAAAAHDGHFLRIDRRVLGRAAVAGLPVERRPEDKRQPLPSAQVGPPGPR
jgi:hypothetical protein